MKNGYEVILVQAGGKNDRGEILTPNVWPGESVDVRDERPKTFARLVIGTNRRLVLVGFMDNATDKQREEAIRQAERLAMQIPEPKEVPTETPARAEPHEWGEMQARYEYARGKLDGLKEARELFAQFKLEARELFAQLKLEAYGK